MSQPVTVYLDAMSRYAAMDGMRAGFADTRRLLTDADVTGESFGILPESRDVAGVYEQAGAAEAAAAGTRAAAVAPKLANLLRKVSEFLLKMSRFAKAYKLTNVGKVGVRNWAAARYASASGYQLLGTNWVIKKAIVQSMAGPAIDKVTGADQAWDIPQIL